MRPVVSIAFICTLYTQLSMYNSNAYRICCPPRPFQPCQSYPCRSPPYRCVPCQSTTPANQTTPNQTTPNQTTPNQTTPCQTTTSQTTPNQTTPYQTTPPCQTTPPTRCDDCQYPSTCINASTVPYSIKELAYSSPRYGSSILDTPCNRKTDGCCSTYIYAGTGVYIQFRVVTRKSGKPSITKYLTTDFPGYPGRFIKIKLANTISNSFSIGYQYTIAQAKKPCDTRAFYQCKIYQTCSAVNNSTQCGSYDTVFVVSNSPNASSSCVNEVQQKAYSSSDRFHIPGFFNLTFTNPVKCVCSFNGIDVINRKCIPNSSCLKLP